jgi:putative glutamine amidotransferase
LKPLIGIPSRTYTDGALVRYAVISTYTRAVELAGGAPIAIPLQLGEETLSGIFARLDGLLLAGGADVHPREFGEEVAPFWRGEIDRERDIVELNLLRWAMHEQMPILGICRGIQMLNVAAGGSLYQDIDSQLTNPLHHPQIKGNPPNFRAHSIDIDPQSRLSRVLSTTQIEVNSRHHQSVKQVAPGFCVTARAPDGVIEGIESTNGHFALGVQFHPENLIDDDPRMVRLFQEFVDATQSKDGSMA